MTGYVAHHEIAKIVVGGPSSWVVTALPIVLQDKRGRGNLKSNQ